MYHVSCVDPVYRPRLGPIKPDTRRTWTSLCILQTNRQLFRTLLIMSDYGTPAEIKEKIRTELYKTRAKDVRKNVLWERFDAIICESTGENEEAIKLPYVQCFKCKKVLTYDSKKGGTSHLRRHADTCNTSAKSTSTSITNFFKSSGVPLSVKQAITDKCVEFVCKDIRPFEIIAGDGFKSLAQSLISVGIKYGQVDIKDVLPHPSTVSRKLDLLAADHKKDVVVPVIKSCINKYGGAITTDMWTETFTQTSYITVTVHYISDDWNLVERVLATKEFDPELRHTGGNINTSLLAILSDFEVNAEKVVFVTDRGANMLKALKDHKHISCCDHMINTVLSHVFDDEVLDELPRVRSLLSGSKELVRYFKKSGNMRLLPTSLKQEVSTRWNTMFYLLESVMKNYKEIAHILLTNNEMYR